MANEWAPQDWPAGTSPESTAWSPQDWPAGTGSAAQNWAKNPAVGALLGIGGALAGRAYGSHAASTNIPPELSQLLQMSAQRAAYQNPLFSATTSGLYQMLPDFAKGGAGLPASVPGAYPSGGGGDGGGGGGLGVAGLAATVGAALLKQGVPFATVINALKHLAPAGASSVTGMPEALPGAIQHPPPLNPAEEQASHWWSGFGAGSGRNAFNPMIGYANPNAPAYGVYPGGIAGTDQWAEGRPKAY